MTAAGVLDDHHDDAASAIGKIGVGQGSRSAIMMNPRRRLKETSERPA
jgi:hypothetical protein